jgi:hypothetical protein
MPNPNPQTEQLALGRGKRPKLNHGTIAMRMSQATRENLEQIAESYGCMYGGRPWIAGLLEKIGTGELVVAPRPLYAFVVANNSASQSVKHQDKPSVRVRTNHSS